MSRDVVILSSILMFWLILSFTLTYANQDPLFSSTSVNINTSNLINTSDIPTDVQATSINPFSFLGTFAQIFFFRIPNMTTGLSIAIGLFNWFLVVIFGLLVYRQARSGAG